MSLINDALKKAQRERSEGGTDITAGPSGTATSPGIPRRGNSLFVLAGAALVLVFVSVGITMYLINRSAASRPVAKSDSVPSAQPAPATAASVKAPEIPKAAASEVRTPAVKESAPLTSSKAAIAETKPAPTPPPTSTPTPKVDSVGRTATVSTPTSPVAVAAVPPTTLPETRPAAAPTTPVADSPAPAPASASSSDDRIHQFIDNIRVAGARAAGNDSRVMMNDKVFRLNEIVERTLSLRLIKVETNSLTFSDANGNTYVKYF